MKESLKHLNSYFLDHDLFDPIKLEAQCSRDNVLCHPSKKFPHLRILHYSDKAVYDRKWSYFSLHCRGVIVDLKNKKLLSIPYFKFFNIGEEGRVPSYDELVKMGPFECSEKLDGSMGILFYDQESDNFYVTTKGSLDSEHGQWASQNIPSQLKDKKLVTDYTIMFEIITKEFRNVIDYEKKQGYPPGLYLIGVRHNISQNLLSYKEVQEFAKKYDLPTIKTYPFNSLDEVMNNVKSLPFSEEGYVIRFDSTGLMIKLKSPEYLRVHRFISKLADKNLLECMIEGQEKDVLAAAPEEYINEVQGTIENYRRQALDIQNKVYTYFNECPKDSRKQFATYIQEKIPSSYHKYLYLLLDQKPLELKMIYQFFRKTDTAAVGKVEIKVPSVVILVGISGSGKSTTAKKLFESESIVSSDQCREYIIGQEVLSKLSKEEYWPKMQAASYPAFKMMHSRIENLIKNNKVVVADATNLKGRARSEIERIAKQYNVPVTYIVFDIPKDLCVERDAIRPHPVNADIIEKQYEQMSQTMKDLSGKSNVVFVNSKNSDRLEVELVSSSSLGQKIITGLEEAIEWQQGKKELRTTTLDLDAVAEAERFGALAISYNPAHRGNKIRKDTILVDLDGTISNAEHRVHLVRSRPPNWDLFFKKCVDDLPNVWCIELMKAMKAAGYNVVIVSARSDMVLEETKQWLSKYGLGDIELHMVRKGNDTTEDSLLKSKWLSQFGKDRVLFVVDDRDKVCKMWVREGLQVLNCGQGQIF